MFGNDDFARSLPGALFLKNGFKNSQIYREIVLKKNLPSNSRYLYIKRSPKNRIYAISGGS